MSIRSLTRLGAVLVSTALLVPLAMVGSRPAAAAPPPHVTMTVDSITPSTPVVSYQPRSLDVVLTLTANADTSVSILGERGDTISNQAALDDALAHPSPSATSGLPIPSEPPLTTVALSAHQPMAVTFHTRTSLHDDGTGICLCHAGSVYALFFSAHIDENGVDQQVGDVATYLPIFDAKPAPLDVSWIWPLLDRPHRLNSETAFTDDALGAELASGGRLDRALLVVEQVVEQPGPQIPLTLVLDPEILDEIWVMAHEPYTVPNGKKTRPGAGKDVAAAWLQRLQAVLTADPQVKVALTPYADPDIVAASANGVSWQATLPDPMAQHVADVLGGVPPASWLAWPAEGIVGPRMLRRLVGDGVGTVLLNQSSVFPRPAKDAVQPGLARLHPGAIDIAAVLTSSAIERYAARSISPDDTSSTALPDLLAELAVRPAQEASPGGDNAATFAAITAPRYVDPDVQAAVQTILATSRSVFAQPISLADAVSDSLLPNGRSAVRPIKPSSQPPNPAIAAARFASESQSTITSLLDQRDAGARNYVRQLPPAIQRGESTAWGQTGFERPRGAFADALTATVDNIITGVRILSPSSGSYTIASNNAPLPITVDNELPYPVWVVIHIAVTNRVEGLTWKSIGKQHVEARQKRTLSIPTTIQRAGRFRIEAVLLTPPPNIKPLDVQPLVVRSTELGFIGVLITIIAGVVLALALIVRFARRMQRRRRSPALPPPRLETDVPEPAT